MFKINFHKTLSIRPGISVFLSRWTSDGNITSLHEYDFRNTGHFQGQSTSHKGAEVWTFMSILLLASTSSWTNNWVGADARPLMWRQRNKMLRKAALLYEAIPYNTFRPELYGHYLAGDITSPKPIIIQSNDIPTSPFENLCIKEQNTLWYRHWIMTLLLNLLLKVPDSKVHGANMGPTWVLSAPDGPMLAPWNLLSGVRWNKSAIHLFSCKKRCPAYLIFTHNK